MIIIWRHFSGHLIWFIWQEAVFIAIRQNAALNDPIRSLRLHQDSICVLLPVISIQLTVPSYRLSSYERRGLSLLTVHVVELSTETLAWSCLHSLCLRTMHVYWRHFSFQSKRVYSALGAVFLALLCYRNLRFTYLLTYLLTHLLTYGDDRVRLSLNGPRSDVKS